MKKLLLLIAVFAIVITANAQLSGGLKAGLNLATIGGDEDVVDDIKMRPGFHLGGYLNIGLSEKLSLQPELLFSTVGGKFEEKEGSSSYESIQKFSYLSIPLSLQVSFGKFFVHAGPQVSFLLSAKDESTATITDGGNTITETEETDIKKKLNAVDFGVNLGAGMNFGKLGVSARYSLGLANIVDPETDDDEDFKLTNNVIQIGVTYKLFGK